MKMIFTLFLLCVFSYSASAAKYNHPATGSYLEVGALNSRSVYGYERNIPYGFPKFSYNKFSLNGFTFSGNILNHKHLKFGPTATYNFKPYSNTKKLILSGMERSSFIELGAKASITFPIGSFSMQLGNAKHDDKWGHSFKIGFATGLPLLPLSGNHLWLNVMFQYNHLSSSAANYKYGVKPSEATPSRAAKSFGGMDSVTTILALWTPVKENWWLNLTYKYDNYDNKILNSPIITQDTESMVLLGVMHTFGNF